MHSSFIAQCLSVNYTVFMTSNFANKNHVGKVTRPSSFVPQAPSSNYATCSIHLCLPFLSPMFFDRDNIYRRLTDHLGGFLVQVFKRGGERIQGEGEREDDREMGCLLFGHSRPTLQQYTSLYHPSTTPPPPRNNLPEQGHHPKKGQQSSRM